MTATPPCPWPAPTLGDASPYDPREPVLPHPPQLDELPRRRAGTSLLNTARRLSNRTERAEYAAMKAEQRIHDELADLPAGWFVLHSPDIGEVLEDNEGVDHVVIGTGGVFTIDVEHRTGAKVWVSEHQLTIDGANTDDVRRARSQARRSSGRLTDACGFAVTVQAVLVLIGAATVQTLSRPAEVHVRTEHDLRDWLCRQPLRLSPEMVTAIHERLSPDALSPNDVPISLL
jgi:hypothetical protein